MPVKIPRKFSTKLTKAQISFLQTFAKSCRYSIIAMLKNSQSGHPGGSLSSIDYLSLLYAFRLAQTQEPIVISNGHISPAVYAVLAELGYIKKTKVIEGFRKIGSPFEGHVTRQVPGVWYGTGPLGAGISAASGFALAEKIKHSNQTVYALVGDGESQEGQVYEMMNFANKYKLSNFVVFMDFNRVQLTSSLKHIMPINPKKLFSAAGWNVVEVDGHDYQDMWKGLAKAHESTKPTLLLGHTIMGKGVSYMEVTGQADKATWHGKAPNHDQANAALKELVLKIPEKKLLTDFRKQIKVKPKVSFPKPLAKLQVRVGSPIVYPADTLTDCRSAYGNALLDLAHHNSDIVALTADLAGSVKTAIMQKEIPERHFDVGVAEQQLVSASGGLSLAGFIPFCSTFGAFMTSRAKDQARVNDINKTNVKMVATHCGLSVGEDGPTHQAIDDMGSMLGLLDTMVVEPADPNHCDRIIRYVASHYGNFYIRMGRHKLPIITKEDGTPFFDENYVYEYGRCDIIRKGKNITLAVTGAMAEQALLAREIIEKKHPATSLEIVIASSIKQFDQTLVQSIKKTKKVLTIEDHNTHNGLGSSLSRFLHEQKIPVKDYQSLGVDRYQLSGTAQELYSAAEIDAAGIVKAILGR